MEQLISDFVYSIMPEAEVIFEEDEFWVDIENKTINIGVNPDPEGDKLIKEFVFNEFGVVMNPLLIGILHEIFHIITYDEKRNAEGEMLYFLLQMKYKEDKHKEYSEEYFRIPSEYAATKAAVEYYLTFKEECDAFMDMLY